MSKEAEEVGVLPKLVAFDLDDTLWSPEMYELSGAPFTKGDELGTAVDRRGEVVRLFKDVRELLLEIHSEPKWKGCSIAYASRTNYPEWAYECMALIELQKGLSMKDVMNFSEVYPGDKKGHFANFKRDSGAEFDQMIFFDNERRNCTSVATLGVTCVYTPHGMTREAWKEGLRAFRKKHSAGKSDATARKKTKNGRK